MNQKRAILAHGEPMDEVAVEGFEEARPLTTWNLHKKAWCVVYCIVLYGL